MFANLPVPPEDKILGLMRQFREDPREHKIDLCVGVYANEKGETIILDTVKEAEQRLYDTQKTKTYRREKQRRPVTITDLDIGFGAANRIDNEDFGCE